MNANNLEINQVKESFKNIPPVELFKLYYGMKEDSEIKDYVFGEYYEWLEGLVSNLKSYWIALIRDPSVKDHFNRMASFVNEYKSKVNNDNELVTKLISCENAYRNMDLDGILCGIWNFYRWEAIHEEDNSWDSKFCYTYRKFTNQLDYFKIDTRPLGQERWPENPLPGDSCYESDLEEKVKSFNLAEKPDDDKDFKYEKLFRVCDINYHIIRMCNALNDEEQQKLENRGDGVFLKYVMLMDVPFEDIPDFIKNKEETRFWEVIEKMKLLLKKYGSFFKEGRNEFNESIFTDEMDLDFIDFDQL